MRLGAPLRVTWDWEWPPLARPAGGGPRRLPAEELRAIGAELVRARVLLLEVGYPDARALLAGELAAALQGFAGSLSLIITPATATALGGRRPWEELAATEVWLDATPADGHALPEALRTWPALRFSCTTRNLREVALSLVRALDAGVQAVSLPNLPLFGEVVREARALVPSPEELRRFVDLVLPALRSRPEIDLRVHHYGLWEELRLRGVRPQAEEAPGHAGCQAGSALAYIDPAGLLYPCASLPVPLERMGEGALARAWAGAELAALRAEIARLPEICAGCGHETTCRGGCRGWAHYLAGRWDATGPDCLRTDEPPVR